MESNNSKTEICSIYRSIYITSVKTKVFQRWAIFQGVRFFLAFRLCMIFFVGNGLIVPDYF